MGLVEEMIQKSNLTYLNNYTFKEESPGRFFSKKIDLDDNIKQMYVILGPNVSSPIHNHRGQGMEERHKLLYGSGMFQIYKPEETLELPLTLYQFHKTFSFTFDSPNHQFIAGKEGAILMAIEEYFPVAENIKT